ncbi:uncharacterized protein LOC121800704 [Salvia splendens]|uniref:uncharacterized protein LOC121800704 n=1 Tax=Salvia splendens TaxID=180675 RepID=UPI001C26A4E3|nr:uncharacterized protein LOC121800704 [Salvia splendens]
MAENNEIPPPRGRFGDTLRSGIEYPGEFAYANDNVNIPPHYISLVNGGNLFHGRDEEDPVSHLNAFYELTNSHRPPNVEHHRIKRALFPFSLREKARAWYDSLPGYNIATFQELKTLFLLEYNSPMKIEKLREEITSFRQKYDESFAEAWKRFTEMIRKCPSHGLAPGHDLLKFYKGLNNEGTGLVTAGSNGNLDDLTHDEVRALFQRLANNQRNWHNPRRATEKVGDTFGATKDAERVTAIEAQLADISTQMSSMTKAVKSLQLTPQPQAVTVMKCGLCQGGHHTDQCPSLQGPPVEDVNYIGNHHQGFNQSIQYNNQQNWRPQQILSFMTKSQRENENFKEKTVEKFGQMEATMRNLETQIGQLATSSHTRIPNTIPSNTVPNPKGYEQCKTAASGSKKYGEESDSSGKIRVEKDIRKKIPLSPAMDPKCPFNFPDFIPPPPFSIEKKKTKKITQEKGLDWMMSIIRKVRVDVSLVDLFLHFPKFSKFFKDLIAKKEKIQEDGVVRLSTFCSQLVKGKIPAKRRDPGSCVIPCEMGDKKFPKCLLDQGSRISLMALKTARSIGLQVRIESIDIELQLADHSIVKPLGIIMDVLVKVDKFVLPVDFIVLEMEEEKDMPILFGRPFLAIGDVVIKTKTNTVVFRVDGEELVIEQEKAEKRLWELG